MILINERTQVAGVAERWRAQYPPGSKTTTGSTDIIYEKLKALDAATATASDVAAIIGNRSWAGANYCNECKSDVTEVVELGEAPDYESNTARICRACLEKALALICSVPQNASPAP